ncbi:CBO0543 family protein [Paenibacillus koleovorans]|uniref:CBO0543 family protein n=1 Tax=Paenibacillus koleovorans TaxID=121608 RepID=UPI000FDC732F|nr:CBO0543 family protein [Paenibacillus koleovorans]
MHLTLALFTILCVWQTGAWRDWRKYHHTMMYFALGNLTYNFLTANYFLWKMIPDVLPNHSLTEMVYTFVVFPASALMFLYRYPADSKQKLWHYVKWIGIYIVAEWFFTTNGRMSYQHGWSLMWSALFDVTMFPMLRLQYKRPLVAYIFSVAMCVFWLWLFEVPVDVPIEQRGG